MEKQKIKFLLTDEDKSKILDGSCLHDTHVDKFHSMVCDETIFEPRCTLYLQNILLCPDSERLKSVPRSVMHLQLLHSCDDLCKNCINGHWICSFYDTKAIYIYDSMNNKNLHYCNEKFLRKLFPYFDEISIYFPKVQNQNNSTDCCVFAIAFAVSLIYQKNPAKINYDSALLRQHLYQMFENNHIMHFPVIRDNNLYRSSQSYFKRQRSTQIALLKRPVNIKADQIQGTLKKNNNFNKNCSRVPT